MLRREVSREAVACGPAHLSFYVGDVSRIRRAPLLARGVRGFGFIDRAETPLIRRASRVNLSPAGKVKGNCQLANEVATTARLPS